MSIETKSMHITPVGGNVFADLGFEPAALKAESQRIISEKQQASDLVRDAVARMKAAPLFFNQEEWNALASFDGHVVSGDPEGHVPENLEADDNE